MSATNDGGPAFPTRFPALDPRATGWTTEGCASLRDYFAAKAMQGDWAAQNESAGIYDSDYTIARLRTRAALYYRMADAMLAAREQRPEATLPEREEVR